MLAAFASTTFFTVQVAAQPVVINEIHYAPADKTVPEEFVELVNPGTEAVDLSGWTLTGAVEFSFPAGTILDAGAYLVVAADADTVASLYGAASVLGPFSGRLSNDGETLFLRYPDGTRADRVDYARGFPWPTAGGAGGHSIELLHPGLDNQLGGSWRLADPNVGEESRLVAGGALWRYRKGTAEASTPRAAWRTIAFDDGSWASGVTPIGYGEGIVATQLNDMRNGYTSVFLRQEFAVASVADAGSLRLEVQFDDGFNAWINGIFVAGDNLPGNDLAFDASANSALENLTFEDYNLANPAGYLVEGTNVLAIQLFNASLGGSSDAFLDARLFLSQGAGAGPTPGAINAVHANQTPPILRQVDHTPREPMSGDGVAITVKATDSGGIDSVILEYQLVEPGAYIRLSDAAFESQWVAAAMNDAGAGLDAIAGDDIFTATVPASVQVHRNLVRYRIIATDSAGESVAVPYADDLQPNFAYFVYDGIPPGRARVVRGRRR